MGGQTSPSPFLKRLRRSRQRRLMEKSKEPIHFNGVRWSLSPPNTYIKIPRTPYCKVWGSSKTTIISITIQLHLFEEYIYNTVFMQFTKTFYNIIFRTTTAGVVAVSGRILFGLQKVTQLQKLFPGYFLNCKKVYNIIFKKLCNSKTPFKIFCRAKRMMLRITGLTTFGEAI